MPADDQESQPPQGGTDEESLELDLESELPDDPEALKAELKKVRGEAAKNRIARREAEKVFDEFGGRDTVQRVMGATKSTQGLTQLFIESGQAVGIDRARIMAMLSGTTDDSKPAGASTTKDDDPDDDAPLTRKEYQALKAELEAQIRGPIESQRTEDLVRAGERTIFDTLEAEEITDPKEQSRVLKFVEDHAPQAGDPDEFDPSRIRQAVKAGIKDYRDFQEEAGTNYLKRKEQASDGASRGSATGVGTLKVEKEPQSVEEAAAMARKLLSND